MCLHNKDEITNYSTNTIMGKNKQGEGWGGGGYGIFRGIEEIAGGFS